MQVGWKFYLSSKRQRYLTMHYYTCRQTIIKNCSPHEWYPCITSAVFIHSTGLPISDRYIPCHCLKEIPAPKESSDLLILESCEEEIRDNCRYFTLKTPLFWGGVGGNKKVERGKILTHRGRLFKGYLGQETEAYFGQL